VHVLYPVHPNPNVKGVAEKFFAGEERVHLLPPVSTSSIPAAAEPSALSDTHPCTHPCTKLCTECFVYNVHFCFPSSGSIVWQS
jgi:hypothetical protein